MAVTFLEGGPTVDFIAQVVDGMAQFSITTAGALLVARAESQLNERIAELQRWHNATLGRETRALDLKREVNEPLGQAGKPPRYPSAESQDKNED